MRPVLVDTSVWVDHFRRRNDGLVALLQRDAALVHPLVIGELACGTPPERVRTLADLRSLPMARQASLDELHGFVERERLYGEGCGLIDLLLLASTLITPGLAIWTHDHRLQRLAGRFGVAHSLALI